MVIVAKRLLPLKLCFSLTLTSPPLASRYQKRVRQQGPEEEKLELRLELDPEEPEQGLEQERPLEQEQDLELPLELELMPELVLAWELELVLEELEHKSSQLSLGPFEERPTKRERCDE